MLVNAEDFDSSLLKIGKNHRKIVIFISLDTSQQKLLAIINVLIV